MIYTDSRSGINALRSAEDRPLVMKYFGIHRTLKNTKIKYYWVPGHVGIPESENAAKAEKNSNATLETFVLLMPCRLLSSLNFEYGKESGTGKQ
ncbi:hypothetical protein AVEN_199453-1 [Araneus ventricosus]|uniref:Uncharacterized protein n=1 Tax=Araneus ventricosus TaxID=182803 RepID=A0A4Y2LC24_ARAVE|nr:hypothetical protein AVEN_199453-1 [Araneus ventricosus]